MAVQHRLPKNIYDYAIIPQLPRKYYRNNDIAKIADRYRTLQRRSDTYILPYRSDVGPI